ncbi:MAG TPA: DUF1684 domain-containing protein [Candidatus Eisenbacteria bacterium]|nr:DUF1684 domain-containing protein [Candidatus Eisenbacteria bacterium]
MPAGRRAARGIAPCLLVLACLVSCGKSSRQEVGSADDLSAAQTDSLLGFYAKDRAETEEWLRSKPTSYFATIHRRDFANQASLTVGSAAGNDVTLDEATVKPKHLRVTVNGDSFRVETLDRGATFTVKESTMAAATLPPGALQVGRFTLRLSHQRFPAIIVFDPRSPHYQKYKGIPYFSPDLDYRIVAPLTPNPEPDTTLILSTRGNQRRAVRVGWFVFVVKGERCRLEATRLLEPGVGEEDFSLFFTDATTGKESYKVGRYLEAEPLPDGRYVLDFNRAYNPACAYSDHYNCPIPPRENRLTVAIRAGEMDPHTTH